jgi:membrane-bound lytic murein transglycosylase D
MVGLRAKRIIIVIQKFLIFLVFLLAAGCSSLQTSDPVELVTDTPVEPVLTVPEAYVEQQAVSTETPQHAEPAAPHYDTIWERMVDQFALESCEAHPSAIAWAEWYAARPDYMNRIFKRAEPKRNMPGEFVLLPVVESAFDPFAFSSGRAVGTWQFIAATGKRYGLQQNWWYDGRRDVYSATQAALQYLQDMSIMFDGDWLHAMAGYNSGEGRVGRAIKKQRAKGQPEDYWNLKLPRETRGYVPKLLGLQCLFNNPEKYGLELPPIANAPVVKLVDMGTQADLIITAQMAEMSVEDLFRLNAGFNRWATAPEGPYHLVMPLANAATIESKLERLEPAALMRWDQITVKNGDTLGKLAQEYHVPLSVLRTANEGSGDLIRIGQKLRLPREGSDRIDPLYASTASELQSLQARLVAPSRRSHRIRPGESLSVIANRYGVSVNNLQRWNKISNPHSIRAGQTLAIFQQQVAPKSTASSQTRYTVQHGDTLWGIARKYRVKMNDLMRWNNLSSASVLQPGQRLNVML